MEKKSTVGNLFSLLIISTTQYADKLCDFPFSDYIYVKKLKEMIYKLIRDENASAWNITQHKCVSQQYTWCFHI